MNDSAGETKKKEYKSIFRKVIDALRKNRTNRFSTTSSKTKQKKSVVKSTCLDQDDESKGIKMGKKKRSSGGFSSISVEPDHSTKHSSYRVQKSMFRTNSDSMAMSAHNPSSEFPPSTSSTAHKHTSLSRSLTSVFNKNRQIDPRPSFVTHTKETISNLTLEEVVHDRKLKDKFHAHCKTEYSNESLEFFAVAKEWKESFYDMGEKTRRVRCQQILNNYIGTEAKYEINLPAHVLQTLNAKLASKKPIEKNLFDEAVGEVFHLMEQDSFPRFIVLSRDTSHKRLSLYNSYQEKQSSSRGLS